MELEKRVLDFAINDVFGEGAKPAYRTAGAARFDRAIRSAPVLFERKNARPSQCGSATPLIGNRAPQIDPAPVDYGAGATTTLLSMLTAV